MAIDTPLQYVLVHEEVYYRPSCCYEVPVGCTVASEEAVSVLLSAALSCTQLTRPQRAFCTFHCHSHPTIPYLAMVPCLARDHT